MKPLIAIASSLLLCSCADMYVTKSQVAGGGTTGPSDTKDFGSKVRMITSCGVGATEPRAIYIRSFCVDTATFTGDEASTDGEMPIRKALAPVEFSQDLKEQLEKIAPTRILRPNETPKLGWLVDGNFDVIDGGSPAGRYFLGNLGVGRSILALHVRVTDVRTGTVLYEFDMAGGSRFQGKLGSVRASGLGRATHFDLQNAAERVYLTLSANPYRYGARGNVSVSE